MMDRLKVRLRALLRKTRVERELDEELRYHLEREIDNYLASGMSRREARLAALRDFGGIEQTKEECREARGVLFIEETWRDILYGARMLYKKPGFTFIVVLILALGIGANTAIFTLLNAVVLKSLPVKAPEQLVLFADVPSEGTSDDDTPPREWRRFSYASYEFFRGHNDAFQDLCAFRSGESPLSVRLEGQNLGETAQRAQGHLVSGNYFTVLGVDAAYGRALTPADDSPAATPAAVVSYGYWKERGNADPAYVGKVVLLNGTAFTVVGVMPPQFFGERVRHAPDFWLPLSFQPQVELQEPYRSDPNVYWLNLMGRLKPGVDLQRAQASVSLALRQFLTGQAGSQLTDDRARAINDSIVRLASGARGISSLRFYYEQPLQVLMVMVALILLIACANVGNLLLSRSVARRREILIRLALGAGRFRLVRQLLTESVLLAALGGIAGIVFAQWGAGTLTALVARSTPLDVHPDLAVLGFTAGISLLAGVLFGLAPALHASRMELSSGLKEKSPAGTGSNRRTSSALVVAQVALSLVLLIGAGLFARSLLSLERENLGFNRENVLLADIDPRLAGYKPAELSALYRQLLERLNSLPGVRSASLATYSPLSGTARSSTVSVYGYTPEPGEDMNVSDMLIGPRYAETLGLPLLAGREIGTQDTPASPKVAVVNEAFAKYFYPEQNAVGRRIDFDESEKPGGGIEIVGVVGDARYGSAKEAAERTIYRPILQVQAGSAYKANLEVRTAGDPLGIAPDARSAIAQVDGKLPVVGVTSLRRQFDESLNQERLIAQLVGAFGLLALILACVGLYGVLAHGVARRVNEIGIRMALGAGRQEIVRMVLREALSQVLIGVAVGVPAALAATRLIANMLYGVTGFDPVTISAAVVVMVATALIASCVPAYRAAKVDPMVALRYE